MSITVIGEANIDISVKRHSADIQGGCVPANIHFHHGGVARNIAHNLCLLGHKVRLMTVFGDDDFAKGLMDDCTKLGMDLSLSTQFKNAKSPVFLSFNDDTGNMQSALSDIELNGRMDLNWIKSKIDDINRSERVVANTLLSAEALTCLIDHSEVPLYIDAVSPKRAQRIAAALKDSRKKTFFALKCNQAEAIALTGTREVSEAAKQLNLSGIQEVFITLGSEGAVYGCGTEVVHLPALSAQVVNVTGSGDAFLAGVVHAHTVGCHGVHALMVGLRMAQLNIESEAPVNPDASGISLSETKADTSH